MTRLTSDAARRSVRTDKVKFSDGSTSDYTPPINTLDPRYAACADHRVGCDCREADLREDIVDYRVDYEHLRAENARLRAVIDQISKALVATDEPGDYPDVPNWRDIRTGTDKAWAEFAEQHDIAIPAGATRMRIRSGVRSWLERNR